MGGEEKGEIDGRGTKVSKIVDRIDDEDRIVIKS